LDPDDGGIIGVDKEGNIAMIFNRFGYDNYFLVTI
jgi:isoaspartyl peptidase/L-asparaginase-like protein (Ntn-hydrolase superfamily)